MRLIDADLLIESFDPEHYFDWYTPSIIETIENAPTVEPVRGKWLYNGFNNEWECSNCKSQIALSDDRNAHPNFCPNCGADMWKKVD